MAETGNEPPPSGLTNKLATLFARAKRLGIWGLIASLIAAIAWNLAVDNGTKLAQREIDKRLEQKLSEKPTEIPQVAPSQAPQQLAVPTSSPPRTAGRCRGATRRCLAKCTSRIEVACGDLLLP